MAGKRTVEVNTENPFDMQEEQKERNKEMTKSIVKKIAEAIIAIIFK